jgi:short-subunit dehydrogenase
MTRNLGQKLIVITGASSGIGAATAIACARAGMDVVLAARRVEKLESVARQIESLGRRVLSVPCDVNRDEDVEQLFDRAWQAFGRLDAAFANAGYGLHGSVVDTGLQAHRDIFETNYYGTLRTLQAAVPYLRRTDASLKHLLICSSVVSEVGIPMLGAYCATKAAQDSIAGAMRAELADEGIHVTSVHPVGTTTEFGEQARAHSTDKKAAERGSNTPKAFTQTADHVADKIVRALRRPRPEVWPSPLARYAAALTTASPSLTAWIMRRHMRKICK